MSDRTRVLIIAIRAALFTVIYALEEYAELESTNKMRKAYKKGDFENYAGAVEDGA